MSFSSTIFGAKKKEENSEFEGLTEAQKLYNVGLHYKSNDDLPNALKAFFLSAEKGDERAQYELGFMYSNGLGVKQDFEKAIEYFTLSAEQENVGAYGSLAFHYQFGLGVQVDKKKATSYLLLAAENGDIGSMCNLGGLYLDKNCEYLETDINEALKWLVKAASDNEHPASFDAQHKIGCIYYSMCQGGLLVNQAFEAKRWFHLAASNGHEQAQYALDNYFLL